MDKETAYLTMNCDISEAESKLSHLVDLLKEANALVDELASKGIRLAVNTFVPEDSNGKRFGNSLKCNRPN